MDRVLEPELMDDPKQAEVYARADFAEENQGFVDRFKEYFPDFSQGKVLDLGCGPADIPIRFAKLYPSCQVIGIDASAPMIQLGEQAVKQVGLTDRVTLRCERYEEVAGARIVDAVISNACRLIHAAMSSILLEVMGFSRRALQARGKWVIYSNDRLRAIEKSCRT